MKRMMMVVFALALSAAALTTAPKTAEAACLQPACFASPSCCRDSQCDSWCGGSGLGYCQGATPQNGGCCACLG